MRALQLVIRHRLVADGVARVLARRPELLDLVMGVVGDFVPPGALLRHYPILSLAFTVADATHRRLRRDGRPRTTTRGAGSREESVRVG
jgi:hypothetical protein